MQSFKALGALVNYPSADLMLALEEIEACLKDEGTLTKPLSKLIAHLKLNDLLGLQENYVALFDRTPSLSLHLYEHLHGASKDRGQAMVELQTVYNLHGYAMSQPELPDFLPLFCEFLSIAPEKASRSMLGEASTILEAIRTGLEKRDNPYEAVLQKLINLGGAKINHKELTLILQAQPVDEDSLEALDEAWEEKPVTFGQGSALDNTCAAPGSSQCE